MGGWPLSVIYGPKPHILNTPKLPQETELGEKKIVKINCPQGDEETQPVGGRNNRSESHFKA